MHAWFSGKQKALAGSSFWKTLTGDEVEVTQVAQNLEDAPKWDDADYLGEVEAWLRRGAVAEHLHYNIVEKTSPIFDDPQYIIKGFRSASG